MDITIVEYEKNCGIHAAHLTGVRVARGKYIIFLDQDDELLENAVRSQLQMIQDADMVCANAYIELPTKRKKFYIPTPLCIHGLNTSGRIYIWETVLFPWDKSCCVMTRFPICGEVVTAY